MSESGKVPQAGSASATTSRHLSSNELTAAKCTPTRMRLHPQNLPAQLRVRRRDTQPPPTPQQYRCPQAIPDWQGKAAQTPLAIEVRLQRRTWIEQDLSMRPDRILPRPLLHPTAARHSEILGRRSFPQTGHSPDTGPSPRRPTPYCAVDWLRDSPNTRQSAGLPHRPLTNEAAGQPGSPPAIRRGSSTAPPTRKSQTPTVAARIAAHPAAVLAEESLPYLVSCARYRFQLQHMSTHDGSIGHVFCQRL